MRPRCAFIGEHRFVLPAQAGALLGTDEAVARTRLRELTDTGHLIEQPVLAGSRLAYRMHAAGPRRDRQPLAVAADRPDALLARRRRRLAVAGGAQTARSGRCARCSPSARLRSRDGQGTVTSPRGSPGRARSRWTRAPALSRPAARRRRTGGASRSSSSSPPRAALRREKILAGYAADPRIARVVYIVDKPQVAQALSQVGARGWAISSLVRDSRSATARRRRRVMPVARAGSHGTPIPQVGGRGAMTAGPPNRRRRRLLADARVRCADAVACRRGQPWLCSPVRSAWPSRKAPRESPARRAGTLDRARATASRSASTLPGARSCSQTSSCRLTV